MPENVRSTVCPECNETVEATDSLGRREFIRVVGGAVSPLAAGAVPAARAGQRPRRPGGP